MPKATVSEQEFRQLWEQLGPKALAKHLGISTQSAHTRRRRIERRQDAPILGPADSTTVRHNNAVVAHRMQDGIILVGSDAHIWPGPLTTMQRGFLKFAQLLNPDVVIANGDFCDFAKISRYPSIGWEDKPNVAQELEAVKDYLGEVERACPRAKRFWPAGNHDLRFESFIAKNAPEMERIDGVHLKDHFPLWIPCWRVDVNDDVVIRHRELGGEHADFRNVQTQGKTIVTGHDHRTGVVPYRSYRGLLYGVRCGFMADHPTDPQFVHYLEAREPNWHPAFCVLTFKDGVLMMPELVTKWDDEHVQFRGELIKV